MDKLRILQLAWEQTLSNWVMENDKLQEQPENKITQHREREAWKEQTEAYKLYLAESRKTGKDG